LLENNHAMVCSGRAWVRVCDDCVVFVRVGACRMAAARSGAAATRSGTNLVCVRIWLRPSCVMIKS
jgi:transposase